jgi:hypothetical protein
MFTAKQIILDLDEYNELIASNNSLKEALTPKPGAELSELEHQEAAGRLLYAALNNPTLFRGTTEIDLGKFKALIFTFAPPAGSGINVASLNVKFIRK